MSDELMISYADHEKEVAMIIAITRVETLQAVSNESFESHRAEDKIHFDRIYDTLEDISVKMGEIPTKIVSHGEAIKTDTLAISRKEFNSITSFKVFETKVTYIIIGVTLAGSFLGVLLNWLVQASRLVTS